MLKDVLKEIRNSRVLDTSSIARNLNTTEALITELISQLERMGYVVEDMGSYTCESKCSSCKVSSCNTIPLKTLSVTKKGQELLNNM